MKSIPAPDQTTDVLHWRSMVTAPRDGRVIIALFDDFSGVDAIRWGIPEKYDSPSEDDDESDSVDPCWHSATLGYYGYKKDEVYCGWIPCEQVPEWNDYWPDLDPPKDDPQ